MDRFYCNNNERHEFAGGKCIKCRALQNPPMEKVVKKSVPIKGIYTEKQDLARTLANYFNEPKKFGMYMGVIGKQGIDKCYKIYAELKERGIKQGRLFMWRIKRK